MITPLKLHHAVGHDRFDTVMRVKEAVEAAGVVFRVGENGLIHGVSLRQKP